MSIIKELTANPSAPDFAAVLSQYPRPNIAKQLKITPGYVGLLLSGNRTPGPALACRIADLVAQIKAELAQAN